MTRIGNWEVRIGFSASSGGIGNLEGTRKEVKHEAMGHIKTSVSWPTTKPDKDRGL